MRWNGSKGWNRLNGSIDRHGRLRAACCCGIAVMLMMATARGEMPRPQRVRVRLDVTGELFASAGTAGQAGQQDSATIREPVEMTARFDFDESFDETAAARRSYRDATASMQVGGARTSATLMPDARHLLVARVGTTPVPYLADGFLSGEESDLLETPFDSLLVDDLLPKEPVSVGQAWEISADVTAGLLAIDTVESGAIQARLEEVADGQAKIVFSGILDGAVDGVPTHVTTEGSFAAAGLAVAPADGAADAPTDVVPARYELHGRVDQVAVVIRERRQASHVAPGFEIEATLMVSRVDLDRAASDDSGIVSDNEQASDSEADRASGSAAERAGERAGEYGRSLRRRGAGGPGQIWYRDALGRFDLVHDTRWRRVEDGENGLVMRLLDRGALVGQCSITSLPRAPAASLPTRDELQRDIERSLAGQVARTDAAEETDRSDGLRVVRVASSGTAGRLPFQWIHYVLAARDGSRASVTFMFEKSMQQRFAEADRTLVEGLRLPAVEGQPGSTAAVPDGGRQPAR